MRNAHPGRPTAELAAIMADRLQEMADSGDATTTTMLESDVHEEGLKLARIALALVGGLTAPDPPAVPKQARVDAIASSVLKLTGWESVDDEMVQTIYRWLFGDEAAFVAGTEMRVEAGLQMLDNRDPRPVRVPHPDTGELVLVTREEIIEHAEADGRVLEAAQRARALPPGWLGAVACALAPLLLASCTDNVAANCPPLAHPPVLTVAAASNPCAARKGETPKQLELRIVQRYKRTQPPNPAEPTYPLRCGTKCYGYIHLLDEVAQGHHNHWDPANDGGCQETIACALEQGQGVVQQGGNYRYTVQYNGAQSACHNSDWGFRVVVGPNLPVGVLVHLDGLPVGIVTAFRLTTPPSSFP